MTGYSGTPLVKKLGIKPSSVLAALHCPSNYFDLISPLPPEVEVRNSLKGKLDAVHLFVSSVAEYKRSITACKAHIHQDGMIWVSWPKKAAKVSTDLDENIIRDYGLEIGLVDVKVCAVDEKWSGLKFVIPLRDRKG